MKATVTRFDHESCRVWLESDHGWHQTHSTSFLANRWPEAGEQVEVVLTEVGRVLSFEPARAKR